MLPYYFYPEVEDMQLQFHSHENLYLGLLWLVGSVVVRFLPRVIQSRFSHKKHSCHELLLFVGQIVLKMMPL